MFSYKWHRRFMDRALSIGEWSKDPLVKVGAIIVGYDKEEVASGYNGLPRAMEDREEFYLDRDFVKENVVHAEANALINALRVGSSVKDCILYCTRPPCGRCAGLLSQAGIGTIIVKKPDSDYYRESDKSKKSNVEKFQRLNISYYELSELGLE